MGRRRATNAQRRRLWSDAVLLRHKLPLSGKTLEEDFPFSALFEFVQRIGSCDAEKAVLTLRMTSTG
jgi:hypothetical protein